MDTLTGEGHCLVWLNLFAGKANVLIQPLDAEIFLIVNKPLQIKNKKTRTEQCSTKVSTMSHPGQIEFIY